MKLQTKTMKSKPKDKPRLASIRHAMPQILNAYNSSISVSTQKHSYHETKITRIPNYHNTNYPLMTIIRCEPRLMKKKQVGTLAS